MLRFFRKLRQKLMKEGRISQYLLYSIGEIFLVVVGILIALQINNWNENRKDNLTRDQLVLDLKQELESNLELLKDRIDLSQSMIDTGKLFFEIINSTNIDYPIDSLGFMLDFMMQGAPIDMNLPSFEEAKTSGKFSLLNNKDVFSEYTKLLTAIEGYKLHRKIGAEMWYLGSMWELRKVLGSKEVIANEKNVPENLRLNDNEWRNILVEPNAYAAIDNAHNMTINTFNYLNKMENHSENIIRLLDGF